MTNLPLDTFTFLFSDIEGSTTLWEHHPQAMRGALARHDALMRQVIERHHGHLFKLMGDSVCAAFLFAPDALRAAIAAQQQLLGEDWGRIAQLKVRMAMHAGVAQCRDADYLGPTVNRVARLLSAAHGGQILLSLSVAQQVHSHLPQGAVLRDLGLIQLRDLTFPDHIFQVVEASLPSDFPPLRNVQTVRPVQRNIAAVRAPSHRDVHRPLPVDAVAMVALSIDGCLLRSDKTISERAILAISQARQRGVKIVLASARPPRSAAKHYQCLGLDCWQINHNGALIIDPVRGKVVYHRPLDGEVARAVLQAARQVCPEIVVGVDVIDQVCVDHARARGPAGSLTPETVLAQMLQNPVSKVLLLGEPKQLRNIEAVFENRFAGQINYTYSNVGLMQVTHPEADKAKALDVVARQYRIRRQQVLAIGDAANDLGMMKWAGLAVALSNGFDKVRQIAHFVEPGNDEDGVASAIEKYVLAV